MSDFKILKIAVEARYKASLDYYVKQSEIGNKVWGNIYPHWETNGLRILFSDHEKKEVGLIEHNKVLVVREDINVGQIKETIANFIKIYSAYQESLSPKLERIGIRLIGYTDLQMEFAEIKDIMKPKVYPDAEKGLFSIISDSISDVALSIVYKKYLGSIRFQSGPVTKDEALARADLKYLIDKETVPEASLFFDVDYFSEDLASDSTQVGKFIDSVESVQGDIDNFTSYLLK